MRVFTFSFEARLRWRLLLKAMVLSYIVVSNKDNNVKLMYCDNQGFEEWIPPGLQFDEKNV